MRISRMSVRSFTTCQANISCDVGPRFHGMPVQDDAGERIVSESAFGVNGCRCSTTTWPASGITHLGTCRATHLQYRVRRGSRRAAGLARVTHGDRGLRSMTSLPLRTDAV